MKTISNLLSALVLLPLGLATACAAETSESCHEVAHADGTTSEICGCVDEVDDDGNLSTECESEAVGSTEQAMLTACGMKSGGVVNTGSCICYALSPNGLVEVGRGIACFVRRGARRVHLPQNPFRTIAHHDHPSDGRAKSTPLGQIGDGDGHGDGQLSRNEHRTYASWLRVSARMISALSLAIPFRHTVAVPSLIQASQRCGHGCVIDEPLLQWHEGQLRGGRTAKGGQE